MPLFMSDDEFENELGDVQAVVARADAFIKDLQDQLEAQKAACADLEQKLQTVVLFVLDVASMAIVLASIVLWIVWLCSGIVRLL